MKNKLLAERRKVGAVCPRCQCPGYKAMPPYYPGGKPNFQCKACQHTWQYGYDGGYYMKLRDK